MSSTVEDRLAALEAQVRSLNDRLIKLETSPQSPAVVPEEGSIASPKPERKPSPISVRLISKSFHQANYSAGDAGDRIDFNFLFQSHLDKDVRAFKGAVVIKDLFDVDILRVTLTDESLLRAGKTTTWIGGIQYNQFLPTHQRLLTIQQSDINISFECENVIYTDGSRESFT